MDNQDHSAKWHKTLGIWLVETTLRWTQLAWLLGFAGWQKKRRKEREKTLSSSPHLLLLNEITKKKVMLLLLLLLQGSDLGVSISRRLISRAATSLFESSASSDLETLRFVQSADVCLAPIACVWLRVWAAGGRHFALKLSGRGGGWVGVRD